MRERKEEEITKQGKNSKWRKAHFRVHESTVHFFPTYKNHRFTYIHAPQFYTLFFNNICCCALSSLLRKSRCCTHLVQNILAKK